MVEIEQAEGSDRHLWAPGNIRRIGIQAIRGTPGLIHTGAEPDQIQILADLEDVVAENLERHDKIRKFWTPRDFMPLNKEGQIILRAEELPEDAPLLTPASQAAMILNLLTEDNLPAYHRIIANNFGLDGAWGTWVNKWTAEENRHAYVMRTFLDLTGMVDTQQLELDRLRQMELGFNDGDKDPLHTLAYVTFQEMATRISHRNTGELCGDPLADAMQARIAKDENLHMIFYRNLVSAAFDRAPNQTMQAVTDEVINFAMPGANMNGFLSKSLIIAKAGIYDPVIHHQKVIDPVLREWKVFSREDLTGYGAKARDDLAIFIEKKLEPRAQRFISQRDSGIVDQAIKRALASESANRPLAKN